MTTRWFVVFLAGCYGPSYGPRTTPHVAEPAPMRNADLAIEVELSENRMTGRVSCGQPDRCAGEVTALGVLTLPADVTIVYGDSATTVNDAHVELASTLAPDAFGVQTYTPSMPRFPSGGPGYGLDEAVANMKVHITWPDGVTAAGMIPITALTLALALDSRTNDIPTRPLLFAGETPRSVGRRAIWAAGLRTVIGAARNARDVDAILLITDSAPVETSCTNGRLRNVSGETAVLYARRTGRRLGERTFAPSEQTLRSECERSVIPDTTVGVGGGARRVLREDVVAWARATVGQP